MHYLLALIAINLKSAYSLKFSFWTRMLLMCANNFIFIISWWVLFQKYPTLNGWRIDDLLLMWGIATASFGIQWIFFGGLCEHLARYIAHGDLDNFLLQPKSVLLSTAASQSQTSAFGDLLCGIIIFAFSSYATWQTLPLLVFVTLCATLIIGAVSLALGSLAFFIDDAEETAGRLLHIFISLTTQPNSIFTGLSRWIIFAVIPAGFVSFLPVELFRDFGWDKLAALAAGTAFFSALSVWIFNKGLKRYESGNRFGVRG